MSAMGRDLVAQAEQYLAAAKIKDTPEVWDKLMDLTMDGTIDLKSPPASRKERAQLVKTLEAA